MTDINLPSPPVLAPAATSAASASDDALPAPPLPPTVEECHALLLRLLSNGSLDRATLASALSIPPAAPSASASPKSSPLSRKKRRKKPYDHSVHRTRPVALRLSYDGSRLQGYTSSRPDDDTVERHLFWALETACLIGDRDASSYSRSGRTDAGVSADGQVLRIDLRSAVPREAATVSGGTAPLPANSSDLVEVRVRRGRKRTREEEEEEEAPLRVRELDYPRILNGLLPPCVRVLGWDPVPPEFHARFSCTRRSYKYYFVRRDLDLEAMDAALASLVGRHDFRNLCKMDVEHVYCYERLIYAARVISPSSSAGARQVCHLEIVGQAFLWHMIRCIASVAFLVGEGLESPAVFASLLDVRAVPSKPHYGLAPPEPLVLGECEYGEGGRTAGATPEALWEATAVVEGRWERHALAAARARETAEVLGRCVVRSRAVAEFARRREGRGAEEEEEEDDDDEFGGRATVTWGEALQVLRTWGHRPEAHVPPAKDEGWRPRNQRGRRHVPLLKRGRGPTYEEKVAEMKGKKKERFLVNMAKRKTKEEDSAFYAEKQNLSYVDRMEE